MNDLGKQYNHLDIEDNIYQKWLSDKVFEPKNVAFRDQKEKNFCIVMPPPNVTSHLHIGHALDITIQDIIIRFKRLQGYRVLYLPGADHAGIATQVKVEEELRKSEGVTRHQLGREKFLERIWAWKDKYQASIMNQIQKMGASCDFSRFRFTMDENYCAAVKKVFCNLYNKGYIYKGHKIINYCVSCNTALSDAEVEYEEEKSNLWYIKYLIEDSNSEFLTVATTRPETIFGDTALAVNPNDRRYSHLIGKKVILPILSKLIPIIADDYVELEFGTGVVKITPAHDPNDFEVGLRHNLDQIVVIDNHGYMNENAGNKFKGLSREEARKKVVEELESLGLLQQTENYTHNINKCYRCANIIEPMISNQWFVDMSKLSQKAIEAVTSKEIEFIPERFAKVYLNWMNNLNDWCISRQLWWGHRIPAYYCTKCDHIMVSESEITECEKCHSEVRQDEDVLDTWFSSALWPFATLGWPKITQDYLDFYPTQVLVTGYDIIFFWVARMIFSGLDQIGEKPFSQVLIHGLIRDENGKKMSKSLGNGVDPLEVIEKFGADVLRLTLVTSNAPGNDIKFSMQKLEPSRNFINKLWNLARFIIINNQNSLNRRHLQKILPDDLKNVSVVDKWLLSNYNKLVIEVTKNIEEYEIGVAVSKLHDFVWDKFCDWYIELAKPYLNNNPSSLKIANFVLIGLLKMLHPFIPFVTEKLYQSVIENSNESIVVSEWPEFDKNLTFESEEYTIGAIQRIVYQIRNLRAQSDLHPAARINILVITNQLEFFTGEILGYIQNLAKINHIKIFKESETPEKHLAMADYISLVTELGQILVRKNELTNPQKETERLTKEKDFLEKEIKLAESKLLNPGFRNKAPASLVKKEEEKLEKFRTQLNKVNELLVKH